MWEVEVAEDTFMQGLSVRARARQPGGDGRLSGAEDAFGRRWVQPFGQCSQHHGDVIGKGFQPVQGRIASSTEGGVTGLTPKGLNLLGTAMLAIPKKPRALERQYCQSTSTAGSDRQTLRWVCICGLPVGSSPQTRDVQAEVLALHPPRQWRRDDRPGNRLGNGA